MKRTVKTVLACGILSSNKQWDLDFELKFEIFITKSVKKYASNSFKYRHLKRHEGRHLHCLFNNLLKLTTKKISKQCIGGSLLWEYSSDKGPIMQKYQQVMAPSWMALSKVELPFVMLWYSKANSRLPTPRDKCVAVFHHEIHLLCVRACRWRYLLL